MACNNIKVLIFCLLACQTVNGWKNPEMVEDQYRISLVDSSQWQQLEPSILMISFDPAKLTGKSTLNLYGYTERNLTKISKEQTPFTLLSSAPVPDSASEGSLDVMQLGLACRGKLEECNMYDMGYIEIAGNVTTSIHLATQIIPLAWFIHPNYVKENFPTWPYGKCHTWFTSEPEDLRSAMADLSCPYSLTVAKSDPGWHLKSNYLAGFPIEERRHNSTSAEPNQMCFYSAVKDVPSNMHAAPASLCCYRTSTSELLQKEFETVENLKLHGSSILHSHPYGSDYHHEHFLPGHVPYLSHWYWDKLPQLYCCHWWKGNSCVKFYLKLRPAPKISRKPSGSKAAYVYGSTVHSLGGQSAFCGQVGEFWLVKTPAIEVQMRTYVVSSLKPEALQEPYHYVNFNVAGSKSAFVTAVSMRSMEMPNKVVELISPEGEFRSYVQVTDKDTGDTNTLDGGFGFGIGTKIVIGDIEYAHGVGGSGQAKVFSFLVKHGASRVGIIAYVVMPGEELMNLYVTISGDLIGNLSGLVAGGACPDNKIVNQGDRIFSSMCDNCEDFNKYSVGRPLYYEELRNPNDPPDTEGIDCQKNKLCRYIVWSTNFPSYFVGVRDTKTSFILPLLDKVDYTGWDVCQRPNIPGLYMGPDSSFNESAKIPLKCLEPFLPSTENLETTCQLADGSLAFDYSTDFACAESKIVEVEEEKAAVADADYTAKHYTPNATAIKKRAAVCRSSLETVLIYIAFGELLRQLMLLVAKSGH